MRMTTEEGMDLAIIAAKRAQRYGLRPFGCIIADPDGQVIAMANGTETLINPIRHSEILAIQMACKNREQLLQGCTLYQTHEPCPMCCGAIHHSKISKLAWGSFRKDLPLLFRRHNINVYARLSDTSHPPIIFPVSQETRAKCIALFDDELKAAI